MATKLIGSSADTDDANWAANYFLLAQFTAIATGTMNEFRIKASGNGNVKVAIYTDNAGEPDALLNAVNTNQAVAAGWNTIAFPNTSITNGVVYWLAWNSSAAVTRYESGAEGIDIRFKAATYATFTFPNPAGAGFTDSGCVDSMQAGWGTLVAGIGAQYINISPFGVTIFGGETD